jgi:hypothetical protein
MAPRNLTQFVENLAEIRLGPLPEEDVQFMRSFGALVDEGKR